MKITEYTKYVNYIKNADLAQMFDVNVDKHGYALYNLNDTLSIKNNVSNSYFRTYIPSEEETPLLIAHKLYNDVRLYWVILKLNNISDAFYKFSPNDIVKYLDYTYVDQIIKNL